jgi:hypothetical protein
MVVFGRQPPVGICNSTENLHVRQTKIFFAEVLMRFYELLTVANYFCDEYPTSSFLGTSETQSTVLI